jgi:hypothetical protein
MRSKKLERDNEVPGRRRLIGFDEETYQALDLLARDRLATIQDLADEAFADLLRKHHRPVGLRAALKASTRPVDRSRKTL